MTANQTEYDNQSNLLQKGLTTQASVNKARDNLYSVQLQQADTQVKESEIKTSEIKLARKRKRRGMNAPRRSTRPVYPAAVSRRARFRNKSDLPLQRPGYRKAGGARFSG